MLHKVIIFFCFFFILGSPCIAQKKMNRYRNLHEVSISGRARTWDVNEILLGFGYEISLNRSKKYLSVASEYLIGLTDSNNGDAILSTLKINNAQSRDITSFGVGLKYDLYGKQTKFIAVGSYKYDLTKIKATLSVHLLFEVYKIAYNKINPNPLGSICYGNCREYDTVWRFGLSVGKYF